MIISDLPLLAMVKERMKWSAQRHRVLAQNVANSNTPGYRSQDLQPLDFRQSLRDEQSRMNLVRTSTRHFGIGDNQNSYRVKSDRAPYEVSPDGNTVVLEEQLMKINQNSSDQRVATTVHRKITSLYRMALGRNGG